MSYAYPAASVTTTNPFRRGAGLGFVIALHVGAIVAINLGLHLNDSPPNQQTSHITPIFDLPRQQPVPVDPPKPRVPTTIPFTIPIPREPVVAQPKTPSQPVGVTAKATPATAARTEPEIVTARVDPRHPLREPRYPAVSRRAGEEGRVELLLYILANGKVGDARVAQSSGYSRLDESALHEALRSWRFMPQSRDGVAVASWQRFAITFRLER